MQNQELEEIIHTYIKENLKISVRTKYKEWGNKCIEVKVFLGDDCISSSET
jgi:hypothetical protein